VSQRVDFIDVSHWQDQINWTDVAVLNPQLVGVIAKCTEGKSYLDPEYKNNRAGALNNGLAFAPYHYLTQGDGAGQMAWFLNCAQVREGERIVLDYEEMDPEVRLADLEDAVAYLREPAPVPGEVFVSTLQMANHEVVVTIGGGLVRIYVDGKEWVEA
jgi:hypothetical protein